MASADGKISLESEGSSPSRMLIDAAREGNLDRVKHLLKKYANANVQERHQGTLRTPLHAAAEHGHLDVCRVLCEDALCDVNAKDHEGNTPLLLACAEGKLDIVKYLTERYDPDPNSRNERHFTGFHLAVFGGHLPVIKYLFEEAGVDPHAEDKYWNTSAHLAAYEGHLHVLSYLIFVAKLDPASPNNWKRTPLHRAASHGKLATCIFLIKKCGVNPNVQSLDGATPLHLAVSHGHMDVCQYLVEEVNVDPNTQDEKGETPLHCAAYSGKVEACEYLFLKAKCNPNCCDKSGNTPIHVAAMWDQPTVLKFLLEKAHADACVTNLDGFTAMHLAARDWNQDICEYLCAVSPECARVRDSKGLTPLMVVLHKWGEEKVNRLFLHKEGYSPFYVACEKGFEDMVRYMLSNSKNVNELVSTTGENGDTPLIAAVGKDHRALIDLLLQQGSDVNFRSKNGNTPLLTAIREQNIGLVKLLLANDAAINFPVDGDHTPLTLACALGNVEFVSLLIKRGATIELPNQNGETPLVVACKVRSREIINVLLRKGASVNYPTKALNAGAFSKTILTPLIAACMYGEVDMVKLLINRGAVIDMANIHDGTPLQAAAKRGEERIVALLLQHIMEKNLPIDTTGESGRTALMKAVMNGHSTIVRMLVDAGAAIYLPDKEGNTPVIAAARQQHSEVLRLLVEEGADIDLLGSHGHSANAFSVQDESLRTAIEAGRKIWYQHVEGPVCKFQWRGFLNTSEFIADGFYIGSELLPPYKIPLNQWGRALDPRNYPYGELGGAAIHFDARSDYRLKRLITRANSVIDTFSLLEERVAALAMFVSNDCGGSALRQKRQLSVSALDEARQKFNRDILTIGEILPGFVMDRMRAVVFKMLADRTRERFDRGLTAKPPIVARVVSRPSGPTIACSSSLRGELTDSTSNATLAKGWPCTFTWNEVDLGEKGYVVVDLLREPGLLMHENSKLAATYRAGAVFHDDDVEIEVEEDADETALEAIKHLDVASIILAHNLEAASGSVTSTRRKPKRGKRLKKNRTTKAGKNPESDNPTAIEEVIDDAQELDAPSGENSIKATDTAAGEAGFSFSKQQIELPWSETGPFHWQLIWEQSFLHIARYPLPRGFSVEVHEVAEKIFRTDVLAMSRLQHRLIDPLVGVDFSQRAVCTASQPGTMLYDFIQEQGAFLTIDNRLMLALQIAEAMEYLYTRTNAMNIAHGDLRVDHFYIQTRAFRDVSNEAIAATDEDVQDENDHENNTEEIERVRKDNEISQPVSEIPLEIVVRMRNAGLPRNPIFLINQIGDIQDPVVYTAPERLKAIKDAEDESRKMGGNIPAWEILSSKPCEEVEQAETLWNRLHSQATDVWAFGILLVFIGTGDIPWRHFSREKVIQLLFMENERPVLPTNVQIMVPEFWRSVISRCLAIDPDDRPSFTQVIRLLQSGVGLEPLQETTSVRLR